ncbi:unnamed protein product [Pylaiella littoralis]
MLQLLAFPSLEASSCCLGSGDWPLDPHEMLLHPQDLEKLRVPAFGYVAINRRRSSDGSSSCQTESHKSGSDRGSSGNRRRRSRSALSGNSSAGASSGRARQRQEELDEEEPISFCRAVPDDSLAPGETRAPAWLLRAAGVRSRQYLQVYRAPKVAEEKGEEEEEAKTAVMDMAVTSPAEGDRQESKSRFRVELSVMRLQEEQQRNGQGGKDIADGGIGRSATATRTSSTASSRAIARRVSGCMVRAGSLLAAEVLGETVVSQVISIYDMCSMSIDTKKSSCRNNADVGVGLHESLATRIGVATSPMSPRGKKSREGQKQQHHGGSAARCGGTVDFWARRAPGLEAVLSDLHALVVLSVEGGGGARGGGARGSSLRWSEVLPSGILVCGPSGVGKTFALDVLAEDLHERHGIHVIRLLGPQILAGLGQGGSSGGGGKSDVARETSTGPPLLQGPLGQSLAEARACAPSVLVLDELDALFDARGGDGDNGGGAAPLLGEGARANAALLELLDCASTIEGVAVLGATRRSPGGGGGAGWAGLEEGNGVGGDGAALPAAFQKPGRFDRCVAVGPPTQAQREGILRVILSSGEKREWALEPLVASPAPLLVSDTPADEAKATRQGPQEQRSTPPPVEGHRGVRFEKGDDAEATGSSRGAERRSRGGQYSDSAEPEGRRRESNKNSNPPSTVGTTAAESVLAEWAKRLSSVTPGMVGGDLERLVRTARARSAHRGRRGAASQASPRPPSSRTQVENAPSLPPPKQPSLPNVLTWQDAMGAVAVTVPRSLRGLDVASSGGGGDGGLTWDSVGGFSEAKRRLQRLVQWPWLHPEAFARMGVSAPAGALLYGPSGCGKSLVAQVLATECLANFLWVRSSELLSRYLGETEAKLRALFSRARAAAPCILFLDELDAITAKRGDNGSDSGEGSGSVHARVLSTLLNEMDGVASTSSASPSVTGGAAARAAAGGGGVLVLAATNRRDALDAALLRPGRLHESVELGVPGAEDRKGVLRVHAGRLPLAAGVDLEMLSRDDVSGGLTCADLEASCRDAAMMVVREDLQGAREVQPDHLRKALKDRVAGRLRTRRFTFSMGQGPSSGPASQ